MRGLEDLSNVQRPHSQFEIKDDFDGYIGAGTVPFGTGSLGGRWNVLASDSGSSVAIDPDGVSGVCQITTGATNNNEAAIFTNEVLLMAANRPIYFSGIVDWTEANTNDAAVFAGVIDMPSSGADTIVNGGLTMKTTASGFGFFKPKDSLVWSVFSSNSTTQTVTVTNVASSSSGTRQLLEVEFTPFSTTQATVTFKINGQPCLDANGVQIEHRVTFASATEMAAAFYVKAGGANSEVLNVDYCGAAQAKAIVVGIAA